MGRFATKLEEGCDGQPPPVSYRSYPREFASVWFGKSPVCGSCSPVPVEPFCGWMFGPVAADPLAMLCKPNPLELEELCGNCACNPFAEDAEVKVPGPAGLEPKNPGSIEPYASSIVSSLPEEPPSAPAPASRSCAFSSVGNVRCGMLGAFGLPDGELICGGTGSPIS